MNTDMKQPNAPLDPSIKTFDSMTALSWFAAGGRLFLTNPLLWIALGLTWIVLAAALTFVPIVGPAVNALLFPFLFGALLSAARELSSGRDLDVLAYTRRLSTDPGLRLHLLQAGVLPLGYLLLTTALTLTFGYSAITAALMAVLSVLMSMGLVYAVPLILFRHLAPIPAMTASYNACLKNITPLIVFAIISSLLHAVALWLTMGFGLALVLPFSVCALYCSYIAIFGAD